MLNLAIQVADLNTAYLQPLKSKRSKHRENYHRDYYLKNREKLLTYSRDYYGVKKLLAPYLKEKDREQKEREKKVLNNFFLSHTRDTLTNRRKKKERFFFGGNGVKKTKSNREEFERRLNQDYLRLATQDKRPLKRGWTYPNWQEWLTKDQLLKKYQEWSIRGGKKLGNKYLSFLDIDIEKEEVAKSLQKQLEKNTNLLLDYLNCFYVKTKKGYHVYLLTDELLPNQLIYHTDKFGRRRIVGSIQSRGKYVVGFDSKDKKLVERGKWFWHDKGLVEVKRKLGIFFVEVGDKEWDTESEFLEFQKKIEENQTKNILKLNYSINKTSFLKQEKILIQAKVLSKYKTPLPYLWKTFYLDWKTKSRSYFLVNDYQRGQAFNSLNIGSTTNIILVNGYKHQFLSRVLPP